MGKFSRSKGADGEREFIRRISQLTDGKVVLRRNLDQCRSGGDDCLGHGKFSFEVKRWKSFTDSNVSQCWIQASDNAIALNKHPVLAYRPDSQRWRVLIHPNQHYPIDDVRGCLSMDIELFCRFLLHPDALKMSC